MNIWGRFSRMSLKARITKANQEFVSDEVYRHQKLHDLELALDSCYRFIGLLHTDQCTDATIDSAKPMALIEEGITLSSWIRIVMTEPLNQAPFWWSGFACAGYTQTGSYIDSSRRICIVSTPIWSGFRG